MDSLKYVANRCNELVMERHFAIDQWQICKIHYRESYGQTHKPLMLFINSGNILTN